MPSGPKSTKFTNRHAAEANARDARDAQSAAAARQKALDDAAWQDDGDKGMQRKAARAAEAEAKAAEKAQRKAENREVFEAETKAVRKGGEMAEFRKLQAEISRQAQLEADERHRRQQEKEKNVDQDKSILQKGSNANRGNYNDDDDDTSAQSVTVTGAPGAAAAQLKGILASTDATTDEFRRKMGRRAKALYKIFCDEQAANVKAEFPNMRRTQHNDVMWERWQKHPQNPFVQRREALASDVLARERSWMEADDSDPEDADAADATKK